MSKKLSPHGQARKTNPWGDPRANAGPAMPFGKPQFLPAASGPSPRGQSLTSQHYDMAASEVGTAIEKIKFPC